MTRRTLPNRRGNLTVTTRWNSVQVEVTFGRYEDDGSPAEVFVSARKPGNDFQVLANDAALLLSLALQYGVPLETIRRSLAREENGRPHSLIGHVVDLFANEAA